MEKAKVKKSSNKSEETKTSLEIPVFGLNGKEEKKIKLEKEFFGQEINKDLLAQYLRVFFTNQRQGNAATKTRSDVSGTTKKVYKQKGTGNARHGSKKAPIFVGGGISGGPHTREYSLKMSKKQKRLALLMSLSMRASEGAIIGMSNSILEMKPKTKDFVAFLKMIEFSGKKALLVLPEIKQNDFMLAIRNLKNITFTKAVDLNPHAALSHEKLLFVEESFPVLQKHFSK
jgi:large subunit ribosomal protein L4